MLATAGALLFAYAPSFVSHDLWHVDELRYVEVAREMGTYGNLIVPHLNGEVYAEKPPLLFWLVIAIERVTGDYLVAGRVLMLLAVTATSAGIAALGSLLFQNRRVGALAAILYLTCPLVLDDGQRVLIDTLLVPCVTLSVWTLLRAAGSEAASRARWIGAAALAMTAASMTKGPVGPVVSIVGALVVGLAWRGRRGVSIIAITLSTAIALVTTVGWVLLASSDAGDAFRDRMLFAQTAGRVVHASAHVEPWYFYLTETPLHLLPWALILPAAVSYSVGTRRGSSTAGPDEATHAVHGLLAWAATGLVLFSLVSSKRPGYVVPLFPPLALAAAWAIARAETLEVSAHVRRWVGWPLLATTWCLIAIGILLAIVSLASGLDHGLNRVFEFDRLAGWSDDARIVLAALPGWTPIVGFAGGIGVVALAIRARNHRNAAQFVGAGASCGLALALTAAIAYATILPALNPLRATRPFAEAVMATVPPGEELVLVGSALDGRINLYTGVEHYRTVSEQDLPRAATESAAPLWAILKRHSDPLGKQRFDGFEIIQTLEMDRHRLVLLRSLEPGGEQHTSAEPFHEKPA